MTLFHKLAGSSVWFQYENEQKGWLDEQEGISTAYTAINMIMIAHL